MSAVVDSEVIALAATIKLVIFDVDGVLTDGRLLLGPNGEEYKQFHVRDGHGMVMLRQSGIDLAIISGRDSPVVARRMDELGIRFVYQGRREKLSALDEICAALNVTRREVCFVGDDFPDLGPLRAVGLPIAVADAHPVVRAAARYITQANGGFGAAREVAELILEARGTLTQLTAGDAA
jgi:3-deoxy-D-manno-octulosonate 8-phosphate phosphatase (KDO 8-P phosphatase)